MLSRDEQMEPGCANFQNFAPSFGLLVGRLFFRPGSFKSPPCGISLGQ